MMELNLSLTKDALEAIASKAIERKTGARGLRSIIEEVMMDVMFEIPSQEDVTKVRITKEAVDGQLLQFWKQRKEDLWLKNKS